MNGHVTGYTKVNIYNNIYTKSCCHGTHHLLLSLYYCLLFSSDLSDRKTQYAHKMAQAHLRSVGMGDFTPQNTGYIKEQQYKNTTKLDGKTSKWRKFDEDEFSFD